MAKPLDDRDAIFILLGKILNGDLPDQFHTSFVVQQGWQMLDTQETANLALFALNELCVLTPPSYGDVARGTVHTDYQWDVTEFWTWKLIPLDQWKSK